MCKHMIGVPEEQCSICSEMLQYSNKKKEEQKDESKSSTR